MSVKQERPYWRRRTAPFRRSISTFVGWPFWSTWASKRLRSSGLISVGFRPCLRSRVRATGSVGMPHAQAHPLPPCRTYALRWARRSDRRESGPRPDEAQRHPDAGECKNPAARTSGFFYSGRHHNPGRSGARQTTALARLWRPHCGTRRPFINHLPFNPVLQEDNERFFARICRDHETRSQTAVCERPTDDRQMA
jgi:hypothetical protein